MLKVLSRQNCSKDLWNQAADEIRDAWAWHRWELLQARGTWSGTYDQSFAVVDTDNKSKLIALVPLVVIKPKAGKLLFGPHLEGTGGPAVNSELPRRTQENARTVITQQLEHIAKNTNSRRVDFSCPPLSPGILHLSGPVPNPLCQFGCDDGSTQSWVLTLSNRSDEELWKNLAHRCRKQVNKARRNNLAASLITPNKSILETYYALHLETCRRNSIPPHPIEYFRTIFGVVADAGLVKSCVIKSGSTVLAIHNFLVYKKNALYWTTAGSDEALKLCANDLGVWHAISEFAHASVDHVECGEAFPGRKEGKLKGLNDFKKSFGGELHPYFRGRFIYRPITESFMNIARHIRKSGAGS